MSASGPGFDDGKDAGALRTIGEVADALGVRQHVLRYWEQHFPMLKPLKRNGGRRFYRPADVDLVRAIDRMVNREGYTIKGACKALQSCHNGAAAAETRAVAPAALPQSGAVPPELIAQLKALRARLAAALDQ